MKLKEILYKTPEMTEERLLKIMEENKHLLPIDLREMYSEDILKEFDLNQDKKGTLSASRRRLVNGFVGYCVSLMTKDDESRSDNRLDDIPEAEEVRDVTES